MALDKYVAPEVMHEALEQAGWMAMDGSNGVHTRYAPTRDGAAELSESLPMRDAYEVMLRQRPHRKTNIWFMVVTGVLDQTTGYPGSSESVAIHRWVKATGQHDLLRQKQVHAVPKGGTFSIVDEKGRSPGLDRREDPDFIFRGGKLPLDEATALYRRLDLASAGLLIGDDRSAGGKPRVWTLTFKLPPAIRHVGPGKPPAEGAKARHVGPRSSLKALFRAAERLSNDAEEVAEGHGYLVDARDMAALRKVLRAVRSGESQ